MVDRCHQCGDMVVYLQGDRIEHCGRSCGCGTFMSKPMLPNGILTKIHALINQFTAKEYTEEYTVENKDCITLYAVDCGGYSVTDEVYLDIAGSRIELVFRPKEGPEERFELQVKGV